MDNREPASFTSLPTELLLTAIEYCGIQDISALGGASKTHYGICRPIIFQNVDLSIHNRGQVKCTFGTQLKYIHLTWKDSSNMQCNNIPPNMQKRQEAFLSALIENPDLALSVKHFSWTVLLLDSNRRTAVGPDPFAINQSVSLDAKSPFNKIWDVFTSLTNAKTLDLAWLTRDLATPLIDSIPPTLFPAATSVRLAGVMPHALAVSILLTNPQKLLHLDLDNLQGTSMRDPRFRTSILLWNPTATTLEKMIHFLEYR